jgi:hypothetical protein
MNFTANDSCKITRSFIRLGDLVANLFERIGIFFILSIDKAHFYISFSVRDFFDF